VDTTFLKQILHNPDSNGITIFILGILFVLSVYHFLLYFQHKDKVYLYYSLYTFLIFTNQLNNTTFGFISTLIEPYYEVLLFLDHPIMWLYNTIYFIFGFSFLNLKQYSQKWYSLIFKVIFVLLIVIFSTAFFAAIRGNINSIYVVGNYIVPFLLLFGFICYYPLFKLKMPLKNYIIAGSFVLYVTSLLAYYAESFEFITPESNLDYSIFYLGVLIENIIFSLGLGQQQKQILKAKNDSQEKLINQLQENENLRKTVQKQLQQDLDLLKEKSKNQKLVTLKETTDKELAELKITSLRSQMNPHFIFNSLNSIKLYIINNEKENAVYYLNKFSKLIRKILNASQDKEISLAEEIETMDLYVNIENIRFNNEIDFTIIIDKALNLNTIKIPSLILQPFLENAIWHGLSSKKQDKKLTLSVKKLDKYFIIIVIEDNGIGRKKSAEIKNKKLHKKNSVGIKLTKERLRNFAKEYQNDYVITFTDLVNDDEESVGTKVSLKIPLQ